MWNKVEENRDVLWFLLWLFTLCVKENRTFTCIEEGEKNQRDGPGMKDSKEEVTCSVFVNVCYLLNGIRVQRIITGRNICWSWRNLSQIWRETAIVDSQEWLEATKYLSSISACVKTQLESTILHLWAAIYWLQFIHRPPGTPVSVLWKFFLFWLSPWIICCFSTSPQLQGYFSRISCKFFKVEAAFGIHIIHKISVK